MSEFLHIEGLPADVHECTSYRDGEWITWRCPHCEGYERRLNWQTGEMRVRRGDSNAQHTGMNTGEQNMDGLRKVLSLN